MAERLSSENDSGNQTMKPVIEIPKIRQILVPLDLSPASIYPLTYAIAVAEPLRANLVLFHVGDLSSTGPQFGSVDFPALEKQIRKETTEKLSEMAKTWIQDRTPHEIHFRVGWPFGGKRPSHEIVQAAKELAVDLIVMGSHGHSGFVEHMILGSSAERVVRNAPCPVLIARKDESSVKE